MWGKTVVIPSPFETGRKKNTFTCRNFYCNALNIFFDLGRKNMKIFTFNSCIVNWVFFKPLVNLIILPSVLLDFF